VTPAEYLEWLHGETAAYAESDVDFDGLDAPRLLVTGAGARAFVRHVAHLWCCGLQDARTYTLLFPVLLDDTQHAPPKEKLEDGAAWVFVDGMRAAAVRDIVARYPNCRFLVAGEPSDAALLQSLFTCRSL